MVIAKPKPVPMRNIMVTLPEDKLLKLVAAAEAEGISSHTFAANALLKAIK